MPSDMEHDIFADYSYGKEALKILGGGGTADFRLYSVELLIWYAPGNVVYKVTGAKFRKAKSGVLKGKLSIKIPGTDRVAYVTYKADQES